MLKVRTVSANNIFGFRYFEIDFENEHGKYVATRDVPLAKLKRLEVAKTMNAFKKVRTWAESEAGQKELDIKEEDYV